MGSQRARVWRLYMSGSRAGFELGSISVHQILAVRQDARGGSGLPLSRADWYRDEEGGRPARVAGHAVGAEPSRSGV